MSWESSPRVPGPSRAKRQPTAGSKTEVVTRRSESLFEASGLFHQKPFPWLVHASCAIGKPWVRRETTVSAEWHGHSIRVVSGMSSQNPWP